MHVEIDESGSPLDRLVLGILIVLALLVLSRRKIDWSRVWHDNSWLILLHIYLGVSILWSEFQFISFKRWIRLCGVILIALVILSEQNPLKSLESVFRRCAYVLVPFSLLLVKYFPNLGVAYDNWTGNAMWLGVASQKNGLGLTCALVSLLIIWSFHREWRAGTLLRNRWQTIGDGLVLAIALFLLGGFRGNYSATSVGILIMGTGSLLFLFRSKKYVKHMATILIAVVAFVLVSLLFMDSMTSSVTSAFERDTSFTGRTDIWNAVLKVASGNPWFGVGYGGYWGLADQEIFRTLRVQEAHSGYLEVYLEGGIVGVILFVAFLLSYYWRALREFNYAYDWAVFGVCILLMILAENFTESVFIRPNYFWNIMVFVTVAFSEQIVRQPAGMHRMGHPRK